MQDASTPHRVRRGDDGDAVSSLRSLRDYEIQHSALRKLGVQLVLALCRTMAQTFFFITFSYVEPYRTELCTTTYSCRRAAAPSGCMRNLFYLAYLVASASYLCYP